MRMLLLVSERDCRLCRFRERICGVALEAGLRCCRKLVAAEGADE
jgi:hypothetical protein